MEALHRGGEALRPGAPSPPYARGGVTSYSYLHYGNVGKGVSLPAFLRFSGYPAGADLKVDHLPAGASYTIADGIAGRTVLVSLGKIAALANDYIRIGYTPTTTIPGHTKLGLQASMSFGAAAPALTDVRTFLTGRPCCRSARASCSPSNLAFSGGGAATVRYGETAATGAGPAITHTAPAGRSRATSRTRSRRRPRPRRAAKRGDPTRRPGHASTTDAASSRSTAR